MAITKTWSTIHIIALIYLALCCKRIESSSPIVDRPKSDQNVSDIFNCTVQYKVDLTPKPKRHHKAETTSSHHKQAPVLTIGTYQWIELECICRYPEDQIRKTAAKIAAAQSDENINQTNWLDDEQQLGRLEYNIISTDGHVVIPTERKQLQPQGQTGYGPSYGVPQQCTASKRCILIREHAYCRQPQSNNTGSPYGKGFYNYADNLGRSDIRVTLVWTNRMRRNRTDDSEPNLPVIDSTIRVNQSSTQIELTTARLFVTEEQIKKDIYLGRRDILGEMSYINSTTKGRWESKIHVIVLLRPQKFYLAADWTAAIIAYMIALSVGCCNDPVLFRAELHNPRPIVIGLICQFLIVPAFTLGVGACFRLDVDDALGLFATTIVPGGGLSYLLVYLVHGDRHLTASLSLLSSLVELVCFPIWAYAIGWLWFDRRIHLGKATGWLLFITSAQILGTTMRGCRPAVAHAIITWVTRPLLLLSGILMVTLGVYINHYAFTEMTQKLIICLMFPITFGFALGWIIGQLTKQDLAVVKSLATETSLFNGLLCMPLLRTSLHAPEGDMAAVLSFWAVFLTPIPLVYHAIVSVIHRWLIDCLQKRRKSQEQNSLAAMIGASAGDQSMGQMGAASVAAVAAAAIAVAPAITANTKSNERPRIKTGNNEDADNSKTPNEWQIEYEKRTELTIPKTMIEQPCGATYMTQMVNEQYEDEQSNDKQSMSYHPLIGFSSTETEKNVLLCAPTGDGIFESQQMETDAQQKHFRMLEYTSPDLPNSINGQSGTKMMKSISYDASIINAHPTQVNPTYSTSMLKRQEAITRNELVQEEGSERNRPLPYTNL